ASSSSSASTAQTPANHSGKPTQTSSSTTSPSCSHTTQPPARRLERGARPPPAPSPANRRAMFESPAEHAQIGGRLCRREVLDHIEEREHRGREGKRAAERGERVNIERRNDVSLDAHSAHELGRLRRGVRAGRLDAPAVQLAEEKTAATA